MNPAFITAVVTSFVCIFLFVTSADSHFVLRVNISLNMDKLTIPMIKSELQKRTLPTKGAKAVLADRLRRALETEGKDPNSYASEFLLSGSCGQEKQASDGRSDEPGRSGGGNAVMSSLSTPAAAIDDAHTAPEDIQQPHEDGGKDEEDDDHEDTRVVGEPDLGKTAAVGAARTSGMNDPRHLRDDAASVVSCRSVGSKGSAASTRSVTLLKMEEAAKRAELQVRASFLGEKRQLEDDELEQRMLEVQNRRKMEDLELRTKLAEVEARQRAMLQVEMDMEEHDVQQPRARGPMIVPSSAPSVFTGGAARFKQPACDTTEPSRHSPPNIPNPDDRAAQERDDVKQRTSFGERTEHVDQLTGVDVSEHRDDSSHNKLGRFSGVGKEHRSPRQQHAKQQVKNSDEDASKQNTLLEVLLEQQERNLLPKLEVQRFSGSVADYSQFIRSFEVRIESKLRNDDERLSYLDHYLIGEPKDVIKGCLLMPSGSGYAEARRLLDSRYGDSCRTVTSLVSRLSKWPQIRSDDVTALDKFSIFLSTCHRTVQGTAPSSVELDQPNILRTAMDKLPDHMQDRWRRHALKIPTTIRFGDFVNFVQDEVKILLDPLFGKHSSEARVTRTTQQRPSGRTMTGSVLATNAKTGPSCWYCEKNHYIQDCKALLAKPIETRREFFMKESICFGCCRRGHRIARCWSRRHCDLCKRRHPTVLHRDLEAASPSSAKSTTPERVDSSGRERSADVVSAASKLHSGMPVVPVKLRVEGGNTVSTYAFMDSGSSACFCTKSLLDELQASSEKTHLTLETVNPQVTELESSAVLGLQVSDMEEGEFIRLPPVYTLNKLPVCKQDVPRDEDLKRWPHLDEVDMQELDCDVGLMIGSNVPEAIEPWEVLHGKPGEPFAVRTKLGWTVWGSTGRSDCAKQNIRFNRVKVREAEVHDLFVKMYNEEYKDDVTDKKGMSQEDVYWMEKVKSSCEQSEGHYQISLPFRSSKPNLPDNRQMAFSRLTTLKRKLSTDQRLHRQYNDFMKDMLNSGYAERVPDSNLYRNDGQVWYIPHHAVRHAQKPDKVRVVFDCPAKYHGVSLNDSLLQGPDLTNDLLDVLLRFREEQVAFTADIEAMFYQVKVPEEDRDFLRFLWWPDGDLSSSPATYRMTVHLFGACSSPSCANFALRKTAEDHGRAYDGRVSKIIRENFYVDDCLKSAGNADDAIRLAHDLKDLCRRGGFNLTKIVSNDREVISSFSPENLRKNLQSVDLSRDKLPEEKALGVYWNVEEDVLGVKISDIKRPVTRRGILSTIGSVFDPLGMAAPFLLEGRRLLQDLCQLELDWDQPLPSREASVWRSWLGKLPEMEDLRIKRCIAPPQFGQIIDVQLHHFADASGSGIGVVSYARLTNHRGEVHCSFLQGKSKVPPLKAVTIPRLELTAAVLAVKVGKKLEEAMEMVPTSVSFWSDSTTVLGYIKNTKTRFHIFVANRMKIIHERSSPQQWKYVPGEMNPADEGSRGCQTSRWLEGPQFLWKDQSAWPTSPLLEPVKIDDPEVKASSCATNVLKSPETTTFRQDLVLEMCERYSNWHKAKKAVAWMLRFKSYILSRFSMKKNKSGVGKGPLMISELEAAETEIIRHVQEQHYEQEISQRKEMISECHVRVKRTSRLRKLNPMMENGLLKVGGRLKRSTLDHDMKHPVILPNTGHVPKLIVEDIHRRLGHQGREHVLGTLREKFWIVQGTSLVRKVLRKCVVCRKLMSSPVTQKMADLPEERMLSDQPPFTNSGVDLFGPFHVKRGRAEVKLYGVVFTCMASRAVHLEVADSLSTSSFINALRRFIARRGEVKSLRSDRGTNFIGAERELAEMTKEWNEGQVVETMLQAGVQWIFNPPGASHFGGVWERQIRTIRKILTATLTEQTIREDNLRTLLCEIEAIINSRPLTTVSSDPQDASPLTPNHLLHHRSGVLLPPGLFQPDDVYSRRWWKQVQYLADLFWTRWRAEYLATLQQRHKWTKTKKNIKDGDIVILVDENLPRSQWHLGKIEQVYPGSDGLVRKVKVRSGQSLLDRPVSKVVLLCDD